MPMLPAAGYAVPTAPTIGPADVAGTPPQSSAGATPEAFGALTGAAISRFGAQAGQAADIFDKHAMELLDLRNRDESNAALLAANNEVGLKAAEYLARTGPEAKAAYPKYQEDLLALRDKYKGQMSNVLSARMFDTNFTNRLERDIYYGAVHAASEQRKSWVANNKAVQGQILGDIGQSANDDAAFEQGLGQIREKANEEARLQGYGPDDPVSKQLVDTRVSQAHATRIQEIAKADPFRAAQMWRDKNAEIRDPAVRKQVEGTIGQALMQAGVKTDAEEILGRGVGASGAISGNGAEHYNLMRSIGASPNEAALLTAAAEVESGFNPDARHDAETLAKKGLPPGLGMYGHNGARLQKMQDQYGPHPNFEQQARFALAELRSRPEGARVNAATTAEQLRDIQNDFEQPQRTAAGDAKRLAATRRYMGGAPDTGTSAASAAAPAGAPGAGTPTMVGDSLTSHLITFGGGAGKTDRNTVGIYHDGDTAVSGFKPSDVAEKVIPGLPDSMVKGKPIVLSTGASNGHTPEEMARIPDQLKALHDRGATSITLMGVGNRSDFQADKVNDQLAAIAQKYGAQYGVKFAGPLQHDAGDHVHFGKDNAKAVLASVTGAAGPTAPAAGQLEPGNIDLAKRPIVKNADGSYSTVASMSFNDDGKEVLIPKVAADGSSVLSDKDAIEQYRKTGQHLGKFDTPENATAYAEQLHNDQAKLYGPQSGAPASPARPTLEETLARADQVADQREAAGIIGGNTGVSTAQYKEGLRNYVRAQYNATNAAERKDAASVKQLIKDEEASLAATGRPLAELTLDRVERHFGPDAAAEVQANRDTLTRYYQETHDFDTLPMNEITQRVEALKPQPGAVGFARAQKTWELATKKADDVDKLRATDPAQAVMTQPELTQLAQKASLSNPDSYRDLVRARKVAMDQVGIPPGNQVPITRREALTLWQPIGLATRGGAPSEIKQALTATIDTVQKAFGEDADAALEMVLREGHADKETAQQATRLLRRLAANEPLTSGETQSLAGTAGDAAAVKAATPMVAPGTPTSSGGVTAIPARKYPAPDAGAIQALRASPATTAAFNQVYGEGAAEKILKIEAAASR